MDDLRLLPKVRDSWSYLYTEHCRIDQEDKAIALHDAKGTVPVPCASLCVLMLGPGTAITHAAIRALADNGCLVIWAGEEGVRFYAQGMGETRSARNLLHQATLWADREEHMQVVRRMYAMRFDESLEDGLTLRQIRGKEGLRMRRAYADASKASGVPWTGRSYDRTAWSEADPVNRALSAANSCLYAICHAAIVSCGYSPALGFIHTGKMLSFVYDIADLYKTEMTIPVAFQTVASGALELERTIRQRCRDTFRKQRLLQRIIPDIEKVLGVDEGGPNLDKLLDLEAAFPGGLWDPDGNVEGGVNFGEPLFEGV
ncbi:MAG: type I-E CRISPR-associated endonuclease Cas1 [Chloroflexi bacterium]|nr:type I-E CRISPR-associated endonuclease Cas1 [Chloroflexota bacterium]